MNKIGAEILLDARQMEPPQPFVEAMKILRQLRAGQFLHMVHRLKPRLLYPELEPLGLTSHTLCTNDETFHILIWRDNDIVACNSVDGCLGKLAGKPV